MAAGESDIFDFHFETVLNYIFIGNMCIFTLNFTLTFVRKYLYILLLTLESLLLFCYIEVFTRLKFC